MDDTKAVLEAKAKKLDADLTTGQTACGEIAAYQRNQLTSMTIGGSGTEADLGQQNRS